MLRNSRSKATLLTLISVRSYTVCPLCQEEEESSCSATMRIRFKLLGSVHILRTTVT